MTTSRRFRLCPSQTVSATSPLRRLKSGHKKTSPLSLSRRARVVSAMRRNARQGKSRQGPRQGKSRRARRAPALSASSASTSCTSVVSALQVRNKATSASRRQHPGDGAPGDLDDNYLPSPPRPPFRAILSIKRDSRADDQLAALSPASLLLDVCLHKPNPAQPGSPSPHCLHPRSTFALRHRRMSGVGPRRNEWQGEWHSLIEWMREGATTTLDSTGSTRSRQPPSSMATRNAFHFDSCRSLFTKRLQKVSVMCDVSSLFIIHSSPDKCSQWPSPCPSST